MPSHVGFSVVGIGASAGGIEALLRFFEAMPADCGLAFVIVLHLSPDHESDIPRLLQRKTRMPVAHVTETVAIEPNHVYVIAPNRDLLMSDGKLQAVPASRPQGQRTAIDTFLRTLAEVHREKAIGIILSGADSDGSVGISRIKETGELALAQQPSDAQYEGMPRNAIATGMIDVVLPAAEMPARLLELAANAAHLAHPAATAQEQETAAARRDILDMLLARTGHDFHHYADAAILHRIERRMQICALPGIAAYRDYLHQHPEESQALLEDMLVTVSNFFRDVDAWAELERHIIREIFRAASDAEPVRAWSAGCATGEEAYSLAMLLAEYSERNEYPRHVQVFASDINEEALTHAREGRYPQAIAVDVAPERLRRHFVLDERLYQVRPELRKSVVFAAHNLLFDPPFARMHLILCRNLLMYLDADSRQRILRTLHFALQPGGYLMLGATETADEARELFAPVPGSAGLYCARRLEASVLRAMPSPRGERATVAAVQQRVERRHMNARDLHGRLLEQAAPPSILIDRNDELLYTGEGATQYLQFPGGELSRNILNIVHPDLRDDLRSVLFQVRRSQQPAETRPIPLPGRDPAITVRIRLQPSCKEPESAGACLLQFVKEQVNSASDLAQALPEDGRAAMLHLEEELETTRLQLKSVIEQYEVSLEDARAVNEEMQAINEELRSATEQLETSREELQSINEEMVTVNQELRARVDEATKLSDDLQNFVAATDIAAIFIDRSLRIRRYSKPCTRLFNLIAGDINRSLLDITHRLAYPEMPADIAEVFERLQMVEREVRADERWYIARLLPYRTAQYRIDGLVISFIDITRRKAAEERLHASEERMRLIAASTRDYAIVTLDLDGLVTSWNSGAEQVYGYTEAEILGHSASLLYTPEDLQQDLFRKELRQARETGRFEDEGWHLRKDRKRVFCSGITSLLTADDPGRSLLGYVKIARDITNAKWVQDEQQAKLNWEKKERIRAEEAARLRDEFFAVLSHELKQPLNLIQLSAEMLSRMPETRELPAVARSAATIRRMVEGQARIIDDLMDLSRLHTGKLTLSRTHVNLSETVSHVVSLMAADAQEKGISVFLEQAPKDLIVHGDVVRLEQIVWNLLSNALKFTSAGGKIWVRLSKEDEMAHVEVADSGKGIASEHLPVIFEMFRQADTGTTRKYGGMGIGLALVRELTRSHGGRVEATSEGEGRGSQFHVWLPLAETRHSAADAPQEEGASLAGKRILLVDDAEETLESLGNLLRMEGAQVDTACCGEDALRLARDSIDAYALIISDIGMPVMDGHALLAALRQHPATASTPAIALSGFTRPRDVQQALDSGFETHARKPVALDQFLRTASRIAK